MSKLRTPYISNPTTPLTSIPATPQISGPSTPMNRPETSGHLPHTPPISTPKSPNHLQPSPPLTKSNPPTFPTTKPRTQAPSKPGTPNESPALTKQRPKALRRFQSTPHLTTHKRPRTHRHPATWPPTNSHKSSIGKPYTWPRRGGKNRIYIPGTPVPKPRQTSSPPSICVHTDLFLHWDRTTQIQRCTRYRCGCNVQTLRAQRSVASFRWFDGEPYTAYSHAPEKAEWCSCSGGEVHIVHSAQEAMRLGGVELELEAERTKPMVRMSETQRVELEVTEWGGTKEALRKGRECPGFGWLVRRLFLCGGWRRKRKVLGGVTEACGRV